MIVANWCMFRLLKYLPKFIIIPCAEINTQWFQCSVRPCNPNRCVTFGNKIALFNIFFIFIVCDSNHISVNCGSWHLTRMRRRKNWTIFHSSFFSDWVLSFQKRENEFVYYLVEVHTPERFLHVTVSILFRFFLQIWKKKEFNAFFYLLLYTNDGTDDKQNQCEFYLFFSGWKETIWIGSWAVWMTTSIEIVSR